MLEDDIKRSMQETDESFVVTNPSTLVAAMDVVAAARGCATDGSKTFEQVRAALADWDKLGDEHA